MRTADEWYRKINSYANPDEMRGVEREWVHKKIREIQIEALNEACNVVKTYQVSNSGSWKDAAVDRTPIIDIIKAIETEQVK